MFERRLADKLGYFDWKLGYLIDKDDYKYLHAKKADSDETKKILKFKKT